MEKSFLILQKIKNLPFQKSVKVFIFFVGLFLYEARIGYYTNYIETFIIRRGDLARRFYKSLSLLKSPIEKRLLSRKRRSYYNPIPFENIKKHGRHNK
jgi:hypothetical protein